MSENLSSVLEEACLRAAHAAEAIRGRDQAGLQLIEQAGRDFIKKHDQLYDSIAMAVNSRMNAGMRRTNVDIV